MADGSSFSDSKGLCTNIHQRLPDLPKAARFSLRLGGNYFSLPLSKQSREEKNQFPSLMTIICRSCSSILNFWAKSLRKSVKPI